jgi:hypothetical protein
MSASEKPLVYLIIGAATSGRRAILADLIEGGLEATDKPVVLLSADEAASEADARLPRVERWTWQDGFMLMTPPTGASHLFVVLDGRRSQVDQIEVFKALLDAHRLELARCLCVVNCQLAERHAPLLAWYEACVHFADVVLLNRREGVENRWVSDFLNHFKKQFVPCLFETVKDNRVKNPALVLDPQARRVSQAFDEEQDWIFTNAEGDEIDEEDITDDEEEEVQATPAVDPYFERRNGGRRVKELPDIAKYLG